ncbi:MAG: acyl-CoA dehydrogenase family protein [Pseudomonadota bacterium]
MQANPEQGAALLRRCAIAAEGAQAFLAAAKTAVGRLLDGTPPGGTAPLVAQQHAVHGLAWHGTCVTALHETLAWARRLREHGIFGELEQLMLAAAFGEYLAQLHDGIAMSQSETVRPHDLGLEDAELAPLRGDDAAWLRRHGNSAAARQRIAALGLAQGGWGNAGLADQTLSLVRSQFHRFADERIAPHAQAWHLQDALIPLPLVQELAEMGVFGLTIAERHDGMGMDKLAMCVVTEELSRACLAVGSLGTRSEIAGELIGHHGTEAQKAKWLPRIASGETLPAAVFTEPSAGSDLAAARTRAVPDGDVYRLTGGKTWITHAARADLMTVLARTESSVHGAAGLSIFLAEKPRGTADDDFPVPGLSGSEIPVLGYRGMKEYELAFDGFSVARDGLLGGVAGQGFQQLMSTFESARIQTAARAVGVAQNALELAAAYAQQRQQFGQPIAQFPRIAGKLAWMAVETMVARQLTWAAARQKDRGARCDVPAGMAKLLAARVAWANADSALQVHGGNGYAQEYAISRVLCDARILSIFEGAAEIQAGVIAKGMLR